jgi:hypothetical protein
MGSRGGSKSVDGLVGPETIGLRSFRSLSLNNRTVPEYFGHLIARTDVMTEDRFSMYFGFGLCYFGFGLRFRFFVPGQNFTPKTPKPPGNYQNRRPQTLKPTAL